MTDTNDDILLIEVSEQPIPLCQLLKIANLVSGGGEAKVVISEGYVYLNGEVEFQKRKKVYHEDVVEFNGEIIQVSVNENLVRESNGYKDSIVVTESAPLDVTASTDAESKSTKKPKSKSKSKSKTQSKGSADNISPPAVTGRRKPISF